MKTETVTTFVADDGKRFASESDCKAYEAKRQEIRSMLTGKIGEYQDSELMLGGHAMLDSLPFEAPWMSAFGACFINVTEIRRNEAGEVEFQLAGEDGVPYNGGDAWCKANAFYRKWPD